jgi:acetyl-CoA/propionyl-CoA carboxylase biotin carboxyl carrier protein
MELWLEIDNEELDFDVTRDGDEILVTRDGVTHRATVEQSGNTYRVAIDGKTYEFEREGDEPRGRGGDALVLQRGGAATRIVYAGRKGGGRASSAGDVVAADGAVYPLMPGTIMEVQCKVGDTVAEGEVLLILEAMKMQNEITAPVSGTIAEVNVRAGLNVDRRTMMVRIDVTTPGGS